MTSKIQKIACVFIFLQLSLSFQNGSFANSAAAETYDEVNEARETQEPLEETYEYQEQEAELQDTMGEEYSNVPADDLDRERDSISQRKAGVEKKSVKSYWWQFWK